MTLLEQMANIGSEVERALNWKAKNNAERSQKAYERALDLLDITLDCPYSGARFKEVARVREVVVDFFHGGNSFGSSEDSLRRYFLQFARAVRRK